MTHWKTALYGAVIGSVCLSTISAWADTFGGSVVLVDAASGKLVVQDKDKKTNRTFNLAKSATISIDGEKAGISNLAKGQNVTVIYSGTTVSRLIAKREAPAAATPAEPVKPAAKPPVNPTPTEERPKTPTRPVTTNSTRPAANSSTGKGSGNSPTTTEWNQYRGPFRDNISRETGLLKEWPQDGPKQLWSVSGMGEAYSSVALSNNRLFTMGNQGDDEMLVAVDVASGDKLWSVRMGRGFRNDTGNGPRGTPIVDGDFVYALGGNGDLICANVADGQRKWGINILDAFGGNNIVWGISESVLIDGEKLICTPGGRDGTMVALNKNSGQPIWRSRVPTSPSASYSSAIAIDVGGVRQYVNFTSAGVVSVRASDGQPLWGQKESANTTANCSSPLFQNGMVFTASGYGTGGAMFRVQSRGGETISQVGYTTKDMENHHGGMVVADGCVYGSDDPGILTCLDLATGTMKWKDRSVGKGSITVADGHIYVRSEGGPIALVELNPNRYVEKGRFDQPQRSGRPTWSHPVVAQGKLFLRDMDRLFAYSLKAE